MIIAINPDKLSFKLYIKQLNGKVMEMNFTQITCQSDGIMTIGRKLNRYEHPTRGAFPTICRNSINK